MEIFQSGRLFIWDDKTGKYRWVSNPEAAAKVWGDDWEKKPRNYLGLEPSGTALGPDITKWPEAEPPIPPVTQRVLSILWVGHERWIQEYGGTHTISFHDGAWPWWYEGITRHDGVPMKHISYFKYKDLEYIKSRALEFRSHPNNGGYWSIEYHEPDITGNHGMTVEESKRIRREQYQAIRSVDPDSVNHPVVGVYDMTGILPGYPGWQQAFPTQEEGQDCDLFMIDCYSNNDDGTLDYPAMDQGLKLVEIGLERTEGFDVQFIPCLGAMHPAHGKPASLVAQFEWWKERLPITGAAFWNSGSGHPYIGIYEDEYLTEEAKEINIRLGLL